MHTIRNARLQLLATASNNLGIATIVAGGVAPLVRGEISASTSVAIWSIVGLGFVGFAQMVLGRLL